MAPAYTCRHGCCCCASRGKSAEETAAAAGMRALQGRAGCALLVTPSVVSCLAMTVSLRRPMSAKPVVPSNRGACTPFVAALSV
jgi:hypothetical protein